MLAEIIFDIFVFLYYNFKTTLPYKWDFCRLQLARNSKILINSGSYFIVYAAFIYWFVQYTLRCWRNISENRFHGKDRFLAYALSIFTAAKGFWPLFLFTTYFFTCSFYPWFTALAVIFLNYPPILTLLTSGGNGLQLSFQYFVEHEEVEIVTSVEDISSAESTELHVPDARILDSIYVRPIGIRYSAESTETSEHQIVNRPRDTNLPERERSEVRTEVSISDEYISGIRIPRPSDTSLYHGTDVPLAEPSDIQLIQYPRTSSRIPGVAETELFSRASSEVLTEPSDIQLIQYPRTSSRIPGVADTALFSCTSSEDLTEPSDSQLRRQLTSREQESIPPSTSRYYQYPSQQSNLDDELQHVSRRSYITNLAERIAEAAEKNKTDSKYQEIRQTLPKEREGIHISPTEQSHLTSDEDLEEGERVSKRRTQIKVRGTSKEREVIGVSESTAGGSIFGDWRRRLGYCGHCGLHDNLPFRQDFTELRTPYRTRSGFIYGPIRRLLKLPDFLKFYIKR